MAYMAVMANKRQTTRGLLRRASVRTLIQRGPDTVIPVLAGVAVVIGLAAFFVDRVAAALPPVRLVAVGAPLVALWLGNLHSRHSTTNRGRLIVALASDLAACDLTGSDLRNFSFRGKDLTGAKFSNANLTKAQFTGCRMKDARFTKAILKGADLRKANLRHAGFYKADLRRVRFDGAKLQRAVLLDADLRGANCQQARLQGADLRNANLRGVSFVNADLRGAAFEGCDLTDADLSGARYDRNALRKARNVQFSKSGDGPRPKPIDLTRSDIWHDHEVTTGSATMYRAVVTATFAVVAVLAVGVIGLNALFEGNSIRTEVLGETVSQEAVSVVVATDGDVDAQVEIIENGLSRGTLSFTGDSAIDFQSEAKTILVLVEASDLVGDVSCRIESAGEVDEDSGRGDARCVLTG